MSLSLYRHLIKQVCCKTNIHTIRHSDTLKGRQTDIHYRQLILSLFTLVVLVFLIKMSPRGPQFLPDKKLGRVLLEMKKILGGGVVSLGVWWEGKGEENQKDIFLAWSKGP